MKIRYISYCLLVLLCFSCKSDYTEQTIEELVVASIPAGTMNFTPTGAMNLPFGDCRARVTSAETLVSSFIEDDGSGNPSYLLLGIKGFETGVFDANVIGTNMSTDNFQGTATISHFGDVGELILGTFEGPTGIGEFAAIREY